MKKPLTFIFLTISSLFVLGGSLLGNESELWRDFRESQSEGRSSVLTDYSYAGYDYCESPIPHDLAPVFHVESFGGIPDDGISDRDAVQAAIAAASENGGGIVQFGRGRYLMNTKAGSEGPLRIATDRIVLRGVGSGGRETELYYPRFLDPADPDKMYSTPFMIELRVKSSQEKSLGRIAENALRGTFNLKLTDASQVKPGEWITLRLKDPKAVGPFFGRRPIKKEWARLFSEGIQVAERHQVVSKKGNTIGLREPLQLNVNKNFDWEVKTYPAIEQVGVENLRMVGAWKQEFVHHRSALDDGGWSALNFKNTRNSWVRDVVFENWNYSIKMDGCSAMSVLRTRIVGNFGHHGVQARGGYGVLVGLSADEAGNHHGPSVGYQSASTVYWRYDHHKNSSFDAHSTGPYSTLLDACSGGWTYGRSGGPLSGMPNHMQDLAVWNFERTGGKEKEFDFWRVQTEFDDRDFFLEPVFVGFHGKKTKFVGKQLGASESLGKPVEPQSLFEAQLSLRLGSLPSHLRDEMDTWTNNRK